MPVSNTPMLIATKSQEAVIELYKQCAHLMAESWNIRANLEYIDKLYQRELDKTTEHRSAQIYNKYGDSTKFQNVTVPVVMPAVEAAVTYQTSVFLTGTPLFGVVSSPKWINQAKQLEVILDNQATRGGWTLELSKLFRDGFKYNIAAIEVPWETRMVPRYETDLSVSASQATTKQVEWAGNSVKHLDMYNVFFDTRVHPCNVSEHGEFAGYTEFMSRIAFKDFVSRLPDKLITNITAAFESGTAGSGLSNERSATYYIPEINNAMLEKPQDTVTGTNWLSWAGITNKDPKIRYSDGYEVTTLYARILPSDFGLKVPSPNTPQVWKFIIVNHSILIYGERQTNAHNRIPILFIQPLNDGLGYQTKPLSINVEPIQSLTSALWNSAVASRRRAVTDRVLYDPSRITEAHINNPNPAAKIPVRPAAYGKPVGESVYQFPFRDDQAQFAMQETQQLLGMADMITGQNKVRQGQFVKGNKTQREFDTVMGNANGRDQTISILLEAQFFTPFKSILKSNILQYQTQELLLDKNTGQELEIDPVELRKAVLEFKVSDGLTPTDKLISADAWTTAVQTIGTSPQISQGYNLAPAFSYLMKTQGADLSPFEKSPEQLAYEQALQSWQAVAMEAASKGMSQFPPQPKPEDYGYKPQSLQPTGSPVVAKTTNVNNITNNITNND
jgi:hypothetical protein